MRNLTGTIGAYSALTSALAASVAGSEAVIAPRLPTSDLFTLADTIARRGEFDNPATIIEVPSGLRVVVIEQETASATIRDAYKNALDTAFQEANRGFCEVTMADTDDKHNATDFWSLGAGKLASVTKNYGSFQTGEPHFLSILRQRLGAQTITFGQSVDLDAGSASSESEQAKYSAVTLKQLILRIIDNEIAESSNERRRDVMFHTDDESGVVTVYWAEANSAGACESIFGTIATAETVDDDANMEAFVLTPVETTTSGSGTGRIRR